MRVLLTAVLLLACTGAAAAQQPRAAVVPGSITVGDVFHAAVRIDLPAGATIAAPDSIALVEDVEQAGRREMRIDTVGGLRRATITYPLAAWRPGTYELPGVRLRLAAAGRDRDIDVALPSFRVRSVLPADTADVEPKPARDVLGGNRLWWPILLALLIAAVVATALYIWWRRRRGREVVVPPVPAVPAIDVARARLAALRREGLIERDEFRAFYERLTETLRQYAAAVQPRWSADLTTSELAARLRADIDIADALELTRILGAADLVKFARARTTREHAARDLDAAAAWLERSAPAPEPEPEATPATEQRAA